MAPKVEFIDRVLARLNRLDPDGVRSYLAGLAKERKQFEEILNQVDEGVLLIDFQGKVRWANRRALLWLGAPRFVNGQSSLVELLEEPLLQRFVETRLKKPELTATEEFVVLTPREMALRIHWVPVESDGGREILIRMENVTRERGRADEAARLQRNESLVRLAAGVAHEIGNPLNSIQIHLELLKRELGRRPREKQAALLRSLQVIQAETKRLDQIVRAFLRTTRRPPVRFQPQSVNEILEEAVEVLRPLLGKARVHLSLSLAKALPPFLADKDRLHQAFINVMKNAIEAMPNGGTLRISTSWKGKLCFIRFEDEGAGIDLKDLPHLFEAYYTTKQEGAGLGLTQVDQTVSEHGGRIDVKSEPGKGTVFTLILPIRQERLSLPEPELRQEAAVR